MKTIISLSNLPLLLALYLGIQTYEAEALTHAISIDDVVNRVSHENYRVYENALRVYQSKQNIQVARMNLLPKLNIWRLTGAAASTALGLTTGNTINAATSAIDMVEDLAPFLIPSNWFQLEEAKLFYLAEGEAYRALWANELMTAKSVYLHVLLDRELLQKIIQNEKELEQLLSIVRSRELLGGVPQGVSRDIEIRKLALQEDARSLRTLLAEEEDILSFMLGLPTNTKLLLTPVALPNVKTLQPLDYNEFEFRVSDTAPEVREFDFLIQAAAWVKKEIQFSIFGTSSMSRGAGRGVFDSVPSQTALGFGTPASLRITSAEKEILNNQKEASQETLQRHLKLLVDTYNLDLENDNGLTRRLELTSLAKAQLYEKLRLGQEVDMIHLVDASRNQIDSETASLALQFRIAANSDKLRRLIFQDDYLKKPFYLEELGAAR